MIEFRNVNKTYSTGTEAVKNANFVINKGEFAFLVGQSGSGKSTLIKLILNLTAGIPEVNILGAALSTLACYAVIFIIDITVLVRSGVKVSLTGALIKPLISALLCGATAYAFSYFLKGKVGTLIAVIAAALIYFTALILLNTFDESDFSTLPNGKSITEFCRKHRIIR